MWAAVLDAPAGAATASGLYLFSAPPDAFRARLGRLTSLLSPRGFKPRFFTSLAIRAPALIVGDPMLESLPACEQNPDDLKAHCLLRKLPLLQDIFEPYSNCSTVHMEKYVMVSDWLREYTALERAILLRTETLLRPAPRVLAARVDALAKKYVIERGMEHEEYMKWLVLCQPRRITQDKWRKWLAFDHRYDACEV